MSVEFGPEKYSCAADEYWSLPNKACAKRLSCPDGQYFSVIDERCVARSADESYAPKWTREKTLVNGKMVPGEAFLPAMSTKSVGSHWDDYVTPQLRRGMACKRPAKAGKCPRGYEVAEYGGEQCCYRVRRAAAPVRRRAYVVVKRKPAARKRKAVAKKRKTVRRRKY